MPAHILIVEDEPAIQTLIAANLRRAGHEVSEIAITFKQVPHALFVGPSGKLSLPPNVLIVSLPSPP